MATVINTCQSSTNNMKFYDSSRQLILQQKQHNLLAELVHKHNYARESLKAAISQITIELSQSLSFLYILL